MVMITKEVIHCHVFANTSMFLEPFEVEQGHVSV